MSKSIHLVAALITISGLVIAASASAETYRWQDAAGHTHYGDEPPTQAKDLRLVETHECATTACEDELKQRWQEARNVSQELEKWLDAQSERRVETAPTAPQQSVYVPVYVPSQPPLWGWPTTAAYSGRGTTNRPRHRDDRGRRDRPVTLPHPGRGHGISFTHRRSAQSKHRYAR